MATANDTREGRPAQGRRDRFRVTLFYPFAKAEMTLFAKDHDDALRIARVSTDRPQSEETCSPTVYGLDHEGGAA